MRHKYNKYGTLVLSLLIDLLQLVYLGCVEGQLLRRHRRVDATRGWAASETAGTLRQLVVACVRVFCISTQLFSV